MRKLFIITALLLFAGLAFGQTLKKGAVVVINIWEVTLQPDATMNQFLDVGKKYATAFEKAYPGTKMFIMIGDRGEYKYKVSTLLFFDSIELRDKYWPTEDENGPFDEAATEIFAPVMEEGSKIVIDSQSESTDWLIH